MGKDENNLSIQLYCVRFLQLSAQLLKSGLKFKGKDFHAHSFQCKRHVKVCEMQTLSYMKDPVMNFKET